jgi:hypothetical protein
MGGALAAVDTSFGLSGSQIDHIARFDEVTFYTERKFNRCDVSFGLVELWILIKSDHRDRIETNGMKPLTLPLDWVKFERTGCINAGVEWISAMRS